VCNENLASSPAVLIVQEGNAFLIAGIIAIVIDVFLTITMIGALIGIPAIAFGALFIGWMDNHETRFDIAVQKSFSTSSSNHQANYHSRAIPCRGWNHDQAHARWLCQSTCTRELTEW
jgi:hypothetical protein